MKKETIEISIKAIKFRIKKKEEYIEWQTNIFNDAKQSLERKTGKTIHIGGGLGATFEYDESFSSKMLKESKEKLEKELPILESYKKALKELEKELKKM